MNFKIFILFFALFANIVFAQNPDVFVTSEPYKDVFTRSDNTETALNWSLLLYTILTFGLFVLSFYIFWKNRYYLLALFGLYRAHEVRVKEFANENTKSATDEELKQEQDIADATNKIENAQSKNSGNVNQKGQNGLHQSAQTNFDNLQTNNKTEGLEYKKPRVVVDYEGNEPILKIVS